METKSGFSIIRMVEIPRTHLPKNVLKRLEGREMYSDADADINEKIYSGDIFETLSCEEEELKGTVLRKLTDEEIKILDNLAEEVGEYELVRINEV